MTERDEKRDETGSYSIATRFGKGKRIYHDKKWGRPANVKEMLHQIEATRLGNHWDWAEFARYASSLGLPTIDFEKFSPANLAAYSMAQLKTILNDFEQYRMILYED